MNRLLCSFLMAVATLYGICFAGATVPGQDAERGFVDYVTLDYEDYMGFSNQERRSMFRDMTPEKRVSLVREHLQRCRNAYRQTLDADQLALIEEALQEIVTEEMYTFPLTDEQKELRARWDRRIQAYFSRNEATRFFGLGEVCE